MRSNFFNKEKLPNGFRKILLPRRKFLNASKGAFLAVYDIRYRHMLRPSSHLPSIYRLSISLVALVAISTAGASVYADNQNVPADSPLYPLKRLSESVQIVLASSADKPQLQAKLAARRGEEIAQLEAKDVDDFGTDASFVNSATGTVVTSSMVMDSSTEIVRHATSTNDTRRRRWDLISSLTHDLHQEIDSSINDADKEDLQDGRLADFCGTLSSAIASSSVAAQGNVAAHPDLFLHFENKCGHGSGANEVSTGNATSGVLQFEIQNGRGGNRSGGLHYDFGLKGGLSGESTSTIATSTDAGNNAHLRIDREALNAGSMPTSSPGHAHINMHNGGGD